MLAMIQSGHGCLSRYARGNRGRDIQSPSRERSMDCVEMVQTREVFRRR